LRVQGVDVSHHKIMDEIGSVKKLFARIEEVAKEVETKK
jgi:hypothetical protein